MKPRAKLTYTGAVQTVAAGGNVLFNGVIADEGINYLPDGGIQLKVAGTYLVNVSVSTRATAAGTEAIQLYRGAAPSVGTLAEAETGAVGDYANMDFSDLVTVRDGGDGYATLYVKAVNATSVANAIVTVV